MYKTPSELIKEINSDYAVSQGSSSLAAGSKSPLLHHDDHLHQVHALGGKGPSFLAPGHASTGASSRMLLPGVSKKSTQSTSFCGCPTHHVHPSFYTASVKTEDVEHEVTVVAPKKDEEKPSVWGYVQWDPFLSK